jgi:hypothetical protein
MSQITGSIQCLNVCFALGLIKTEFAAKEFELLNTVEHVRATTTTGSLIDALPARLKGT